MSTIVLTSKAAKLMKLSEIEGFESLDDLLQATATDSVCPAICMTEGCDYTAEMEPDCRFRPIADSHSGALRTAIR
jgi:hypothetical protein